MRTSKSVGLACVLAMILCSSAAFGSPPAWSPSTAIYFLDGGLSVSSAPDVFSDYWSLGFNVGGGIGYAATPVVHVLASFRYNRFGLDEDEILASLSAVGFNVAGVTVSGGAATTITGMAELRLLLPTGGSAASPYFSGGLGLFRISADDVTATGPGGTARINGSSETDLCVAFGAGLRFHAGPHTRLLLGGMYTIGFSEGQSTQYFPVSVGFEFH
jgi:opacity protein-like surface antigen